MERAGLDPRHIGAHRKAHADFVTQVEAMRLTPRPDGALPGLYNFVTSWLSFHILDTDQSMARQLRAVAAGAASASLRRRPGPEPRPGSTPDRCGAQPARAGGRAQQGAAEHQRQPRARVAERTAALTAANRDLPRPSSASTRPTVLPWWASWHAWRRP